MLKVDLIYSSWITAPNGASHFVGRMKEMKGLFAENGIDLRVITPDLFNPREFANESVVRQKPLKKFCFWLAKYSVILTRIIIHKAYDKSAISVVDYYEKLPDKGEVLAFQETTTCYYYLKRNKEHKQKVLLTIHGSGDMWSMWYHRYPRLKGLIMKPYRKDIENTLFTGCDKIGFVADYPRKYFCANYPFEEKKTYFAYTSIETSVEPQPMVIGDKVKLITSGGLSDRKNQMGVLNAIGLLSDDYQKQIKYTLLSNGEMREALEAKARTLKAEVIFTGKVEKVEDYLRQANCFVLYSKDEGQPMSIVEAMREGLAIIGSNVAGIPEQIIDGKTGYVVDLNENSLAEKLRYIIDHKDELPAMGQASYKLFLEKFTIDSMVKKYAEIYKKC